MKSLSCLFFDLRSVLKSFSHFDSIYKIVSDSVELDLRRWSKQKHILIQDEYF